MFAADEATPVRFEVEAPCTDPRRFAEGVTDRTPRVLPTDARDADAVQVKIEGTRGTFVIASRSGPPSAPRTLEGSSCEEVADALGLAVALVFDPDATDQPKAKSPPPSAPPKPPPPAPPVRMPAPRPPKSTSPASAMAAPRVAMGIQASVAGARRLPLGVFAFGELASSRATARLAFGFQHVSVDVGPRSADFTWGLLVPDVCPFRFEDAPLELLPCLGMAVGVIEADPNDIPGAQSFTRAWIAPKPILRVRLTLASSFALEAQLGAEIPLLRSRYTFAGTTAYDVNAVVPSFALGGWFSP